jgi:hypothetical protein
VWVWAFSKAFFDFPTDTDTLTVVSEGVFLEVGRESFGKIELVEGIKAGDDMVGCYSVREWTGEFGGFMRLVEVWWGVEGIVDGDEDGEVFRGVGEEFFDLVVVFDEIVELFSDVTFGDEVVEG